LKPVRANGMKTPVPGRNNIPWHSRGRNLGRRLNGESTKPAPATLKAWRRGSGGKGDEVWLPNLVALHPRDVRSA
jgi:hypothetical protein